MEIQQLALTLCKLRFYLPQIFSQTARYVTVVACINQFILTTNHAHLFRTVNRPSVTRYSIGIVFIFRCIFITPILILTTISNEQCGQFGLI
jgi:hypothetical protein